METEAATHRCLEPFQCESLRGWDFRPQLIVVSGLFGGNPFVDGILGHNLLLSPAFLVGIPSWMGFWLSGSLSHELFFFHDEILAIRKPFSRTFLFSRWNSGYQEAFLMNFSFFTMEFWLSGSLSHELFFHDGILEIHNLGEDSFYIYITKSIYIGSASLKTLPLDLEPPLQGKEYGPPYSNATRKSKANVFSEITYRHVIQIF
jgi:hypothetical protein